LAKNGGIALTSDGQVRIVELLLATIIIAIAVIFALFFSKPIRSIYIRETSDLRRLAYNLLNNFAMAGIYENVIIRGNLTGRPWTEELRVLVSASLPPEVIYYMEIYEAKIQSGSVKLKLMGKVFNAPDFWSANIIEAESVTYTYVSTGEPDKTRGVVLIIHFVLGFGG